MRGKGNNKRYVFLIDGNVESKVSIQEEIRARRIVIVNDEGLPVVVLSLMNIMWSNIY